MIFTAACRRSNAVELTVLGLARGPQAGLGAPDALQQMPLDPPEPDRADRPISYVLADWIAVYLAEDGEVQSIEAVEQVLGLRLDPETGRATAGSAPMTGGAP